MTHIGVLNEEIINYLIDHYPGIRFFGLFGQRGGLSFTGRYAFSQSDST
jgi:hypothetical protein